MVRRVIFIGAGKEQKAWGGSTGDWNSLIPGNTYTVNNEEVHSWHTRLFLDGFEGWFNSVCFEPTEF